MEASGIGKVCGGRFLLVRVFEDAVHEIEREKAGQVVEHDGRDDLVAVAVGADPARGEGPKGTGGYCGCCSRGDSQGAGKFEADDGGGKSSDGQLAFDADVEEAGSEGDENGEAGDEERGGLFEGSGDGCGGAEASLDEGGGGIDGVVVRQEEGRDEDGDGSCAEGEDFAQAAPTIRRPMRSRSFLASLRWPRDITTMRSQCSRSSSRSKLMTRAAMPSWHFSLMAW